MPASTPPPLSYIVRYEHPVHFVRTAMIKADSLAAAQAFAAATVAGTIWTVISVTPYTG